MKIKYLFVLMLAFLIYGCSDINSVHDFNDNENGLVCVRGSLSEEMRTAVPGNIPDSGIAYAVRAEAVTGGQSVEKAFAEKSFTLTLLPGTYKFSARVIEITDITGFNPDMGYSVLLSGEISDEIEIQQGKQITLEKIILRPVQNSGNSGTVKLKISTQVSSITKMKYEYIKNNTKIEVENNFSDNEVYFQLEPSIDSGTYFVDFSFMDSDGNLIYKVLHEAVNVYDHLETNKWIKSSNSLHLKTGEFVITPACVASFKHGPDYYVSSTGSDENEKTGTFFDPLASVQKAVDLIIAANDGVTAYNIILNNDISGTIVKTDENYGNSFVQILPDKKLNLTIKSSDGSLKALLSSSTNARVLCAAGESQKLTLNLEKVQIAGGFTPTSDSGGVSEDSLCGGGIFVGKNCDLTLTDCVIGETSTLSGVQSSIPSFNSVKNEAGSGSAIYLSDSDSSTVTLKNTKIENCKSGNEGTVYAGGKSFTMDSSSVIAGNLANNLGSAIVADNDCIVTVSGTISNNYSTHNYPAICVRGNASVTLANAEIKDNGIDGCFESRCGLHVSEDTLGTVKVNGNVTLEGILFSGWASKKVEFYSRLTNTECFAVFQAQDDSSNYYIPDGLEIYVNKTSSSIADLFTYKNFSLCADTNSWVITETSKVGKLECSNSNGGQLPDPSVYELTGKLTDISGNDITSISKNGGDVYFRVYKDGADISADIGNFEIEGYSDGVKLDGTQITLLPVQTDCKVSISTVNYFTLEPGTTFSIYITYSYNGVSGYSSNFNLSVTD